MSNPTPDEQTVEKIIYLLYGDLFHGLELIDTELNLLYESLEIIDISMMPSYINNRLITNCKFIRSIVEKIIEKLNSKGNP